MDAAGLKGRLDDVATASQVDNLERSLQAWSTGVDAMFALPSQGVLELSRRDGRVHGTLILVDEPDAVTLDFRVPADAVAVRTP